MGLWQTFGIAHLGTALHQAAINISPQDVPRNDLSAPVQHVAKVVIQRHMQIHVIIHYKRVLPSEQTNIWQILSSIVL